MSGDPLLGSIGMFGGNFNPRAWAFCDGQLLPISSNSALFSLLGTIYGGDGRTSFALPDLRGRVAVHPGNGPGLSSYRLGQRGGIEKVVLQVNQIPSHNHVGNINLGAGAADKSTGVGQAIAANTTGDTIFTDQPPSTSARMNSASLSINNTGGSQSHINIQPFLCINYCIALQGIFPSRS